MSGWRKRQVVEMAREAGAVFPADGSYHQFETLETLEAFAALVRADEREKFLGVLRQLHDSYSLASDPSGLRVRGDKHD